MNAWKAKRITDKLIKHVPKCPRCTKINQRIASCPYIIALPNDAIKEANQHIPNCPTCSKALEEMFNCPSMKCYF